jgi:hypothetical protein
MCFNSGWWRSTGQAIDRLTSDFRRYPNEGDWGHWWIELSKEYFAKTRSFGWWPKNRVLGVADALKGVDGQLNGMYDDLGQKINTWDDEHDTHEGDKKGKVYPAKIIHDSLKARTLQYGSGKGKKCCDLDPELATDTVLVAECVAQAAKAFAQQHKSWRYPLPHNCHTFQKWLLKQCCICKPGLFAKAEKNYDKDADDDKNEIDA